MPEKTVLIVGLQPTLIDFGGTAETVRQEKLAHRHAPQARLCCNTRPDDTAEPVRRWVYQQAADRVREKRQKMPSIME